jgi:hypothetical protein
VLAAANADDRGMSETAARRSTTGSLAKLARPILVIAAIAVVIVFDPLGELAGSVGLGSIGLPGWIDWIRDLPGPGLLIVIVALIVLGEWGRREKNAEDCEDAR